MTACPRCNAAPDRVETRDGASRKCTACGLVFDPARSRKQPATTTIALNAPEGFEGTLTRAGMTTTYRDGAGGKAELVIVHRWSKTPSFQYVMAGVWVFVTLVGPALGIESGAPALLFGVIALVLLVVTYILVASRVNTTRITVGSGRLAVSHAPLPWFGSVAVEADSIMQIYCQDHASKLNPDTDVYRVLAIIRGQKRPTVLVDGLELATHALFLEHAIERALDIEDRAVDGEADIKPR